jgi:hypothetical protein
MNDCGSKALQQRSRAHDTANIKSIAMHQIESDDLNPMSANQIDKRTSRLARGKRQRHTITFLINVQKQRT